MYNGYMLNNTDLSNFNKEFDELLEVFSNSIQRNHNFEYPINIPSTPGIPMTRNDSISFNCPVTDSVNITEDIISLKQSAKGRSPIKKLSTKVKKMQTSSCRLFLKKYNQSVVKKSKNYLKL